MDWSPNAACGDLTHAVTLLSSYGLKLSTKWAAEQLIGLDPTLLWATPPPPSTPFAGQFDQDEFDHASTTPPHGNRSATKQSPSTPPHNHSLPPPPSPHTAKITFAHSLLSLGEYSRAAHILSHDGLALPNLPSTGSFIRFYSRFLAGEKKKEEEIVELAEPLERTKVHNEYLPHLHTELSALYATDELDAFGLYMYGVVLKERLQTQTFPKPMTPDDEDKPPVPTATDALLHQTKDVFVESILGYPYNWSAWLDLAEICIENTTIHDTVEQALATLTSSYMYHMFLIHVFLEQQQNDSALQVIEKVVRLFPASNYLRAQTALAFYNLRDFDRAQSHFLELCKNDPFRLEQMDIFSNILYVKESKAELSHLAHTASAVDKYRPEVCCIIGNYYSLKGSHGKAVQYFQRALKLNRKFLSAWTLMGHEFVEMKNTGAAIEAYRRAVDINARDYRAWYGLGQVYEILNMLLYALYYYRKAAALRPYDARMWCAMGSCYLSLDRRQEAIKSYERAINNVDREGIATRKLAKLYREEGDMEKAARCYQRLISNSGSGGGDLDSAEAEALIFLANFEKDAGNYDVAAAYCTRLLEHPGQEEAKALLRDIRSRIN